MNPKVYLIWGLHPQTFPRAVVQLVHDVVKIFRSDGGEIPVLRKKLADEAIGVFVEATFP